MDELSEHDNEENLIVDKILDSLDEQKIDGLSQITIICKALLEICNKNGMEISRKLYIGKQEFIIKLYEE